MHAESNAELSPGQVRIRIPERRLSSYGLGQAFCFAVLPPAVQRVCVKPVERATASAIHVAQAYTPLLLCFQPATGSFEWFGYLMLYLNQPPASLQHVPGALVGWQSCSCGPLGAWGRQGCFG